MKGMNSEVIRKLALQQIQEEEQKKKEEEIKLAVALEVERLRSRPSTELVKDDLSELKNEILELKRKVSYLEIQLNNKPLERKVLELATLMGNSTLSFRSGHGLTKRNFYVPYRVVVNNGSNNCLSCALTAGGIQYSFTIDYSKRIFQIAAHHNNENKKIIEYTFKECCIDPYDESKIYKITAEFTSEYGVICIGDVIYKQELSRKYRPEQLFENDFIALHANKYGIGFTEYY